MDKNKIEMDVESKKIKFERMELIKIIIDADIKDNEKKRILEILLG